MRRMRPSSNVVIMSPSRSPLVLALAVAAGAILPVQFAVNGALAKAVGSVTFAGATSYWVGGVALVGVIALLRQRADWAAARALPPWAWSGGVLGSAYVAGSVVLTGALGAATATTFVIAAQVVAAVALDHVGAFGLPRRPVNARRLGALALVLAALALRLAEARA